MQFHSLYRCYGMALHLETSAIVSTMLHTVTFLTLVISFSCSSAELAQSTFAAMKKQNIQFNLSITHYLKTKGIYITMLLHLFFFLMTNIKTCNGQWVRSIRLEVKLQPTSTRSSRNCACCWISEWTRLSCHGFHPSCMLFSMLDETSIEYSASQSVQYCTISRGVYLPWTHTMSVCTTYITKLSNGTLIHDQWYVTSTTTSEQRSYANGNLCLRHAQGKTYVE